MRRVYTPTRVLIWAKTYPELSSRHRETVGTAGCLADGRPIRLYPVQLRYLAAHQQYQLYDWVEVPVVRNTVDPRPESHRVDAQHMEVVGNVGTENGAWTARERTIFADRSRHYECLEDLKREQERSRRSLGLVSVGPVDRIWLEERPPEDRETHAAKLAQLCRQVDLFGIEQRDLEFLPWKIKLAWQCCRRTGPRGERQIGSDWEYSTKPSPARQED